MATDNLTTNKITIDRGDEEYVFVDTFGDEFCRIRFNPGDSGLLKRYKEVLINLENFSMNESEDITPENLLAADEFLVEQFSYLIGRKNAGGAFETTSPLAILKDGQFFFQVVLKTIASIVSDAIDKRYAKTRENIMKAVDEVLAAIEQK